MNATEPKYLTRQIRIVGGSLTIVIPQPIAQALGLYQGNYLAIRQVGEEIVLSRLHLNANPERENLHARIPPGKHGRLYRKRQGEEV